MESFNILFPDHPWSHLGEDIVWSLSQLSALAATREFIQFRKHNSMRPVHFSLSSDDRQAL